MESQMSLRLDTDSVFVSGLRVLKAEELEKVVGAQYNVKPGGRYKSFGGPDNASKDPI